MYAQGAQKVSPSDQEIKVISVKWDKENRSSHVHLSNGKIIDSIGDSQHLEHLLSLSVKDNQDKPLHVFLFKRQCESCDVGSDLLVYVYESDSSEPLALPGKEKDDES